MKPNSRLPPVFEVGPKHRSDDGMIDNIQQHNVKTKNDLDTCCMFARIGVGVRWEVQGLTVFKCMQVVCFLIILDLSLFSTTNMLSKKGN